MEQEILEQQILAAEGVCVVPGDVAEEAHCSAGGQGGWSQVQVSEGGGSMTAFP